MDKATQIGVLANIVRLGVADRAQALGTLRRWRRMQGLTRRMIATGSAADLPWRLRGCLPDDVQDRLFMSFHYGLWPLGLAALARHAPGRAVHALISRADEAYRARMTAIAAAAGIRLELIDGGVSMLRGVRKARAEGGLLFVLIDVPWGIAREADRHYPFAGGRIAAKTALFRFAERAGLTPHLLVADFDDERRETQIISHGALDQAQCFALLDACVTRKPWLWDRLFDMHQYVELPMAARYLPFSADGARYIAELHSRRVLRVNRALFESVLLARRLAARGEPEASRRVLDTLRGRSALQIDALF